MKCQNYRMTWKAPEKRNPSQAYSGLIEVSISSAPVETPERDPLFA
jgi:hypothetical protein